MGKFKFMDSEVIGLGNGVIHTPTAYPSGHGMPRSIFPNIADSMRVMNESAICVGIIDLGDSRDNLDITKNENSDFKEFYY